MPTDSLERELAVRTAQLIHFQLSCPLDLRILGWTVAVHNDYLMDGELHTFWGFSRGDRWIRGEGKTDLEALDSIRAALGLPTSGELLA